MRVGNYISEDIDPFEGKKLEGCAATYKDWVLDSQDVDGVKTVQVIFFSDVMETNRTGAAHDTIIYRRNPEVVTSTIVGSGTIGYIDIGTRAFGCLLNIPQGAVNGIFTGTVTPVSTPDISAVEFTGWDITPSPITFNSPCTLIIGYSDLNQDGVVDETSIQESDLAVFWYDESRGGWMNLGGVVDTVRNCVSVQITHLSRFVLASRYAIPSLSDIPSSVLLGNLMLEYNPYDPVDDGNNPFQFDLGRAANVTIKVYDTVGDLVSTVADEKYCAGKIREKIDWYGKTNGGSYLKPGLYVFQIKVKATDGETRIKTGGICIVR
jgi:hypothetical protein